MYSYPEYYHRVLLWVASFFLAQTCFVPGYLLGSFVAACTYLNHLPPAYIYELGVTQVGVMFGLDKHLL